MGITLLFCQQVIPFLRATTNENNDMKIILITVLMLTGCAPFHSPDMVLKHADNIAKLQELKNKAIQTNDFIKEVEILKVKDKFTKSDMDKITPYYDINDAFIPLTPRLHDEYSVDIEPYNEAVNEFKKYCDKVYYYIHSPIYTCYNMGDSIHDHRKQLEDDIDNIEKKIVAYYSDIEKKKIEKCIKKYEKKYDTAYVRSVGQAFAMHSNSFEVGKAYALFSPMIEVFQVFDEGVILKSNHRNTDRLIYVPMKKHDYFNGQSFLSIANYVYRENYRYTTVSGAKNVIIKLEEQHTKDICPDTVMLEL